MDFEYSSEQKQLLESVRKLMQRVATPDYLRRLDRERLYPYEVYDAWVEAGVFALPFAEEYGGLGGSVLDLAIVAEEIGRYSADVAMAFGGSIFCALNVARKGSEEQKRYWLPKLISGEIRMSISMSEPDAGSDVGAMRTQARRDGNEYVITGQKIWATGAGAKNNVINVYVKTDPKAHYRQGMSLFLVDNNTPGLEIRRLDMLGRRSVGTFELNFNDARIPPDRLIGGENKGWDCILSGLQAERVVAAACDCGSARGALDLAVELRQGAASVRPADRQFPGDRTYARQYGSRDRSRLGGDPEGCLAREPQRECAQGNHHGEASCRRSLRESIQRRHAGDGRLRLQHGVRHAAALSRRACRDHRRRYFGAATQSDRRPNGPQGTVRMSDALP